jgi:hypothetical protein
LIFESWHSALLQAQRLPCPPARLQFFKVPAQPHMTYSQQHAAAKLIPKGPDIENATRIPDSLLAFVNMFRDTEAPDDSPEAVTARETFCEDFYFVDEPGEIKNAAIHISMVLTSLATNISALYQPHRTFGEQLRASILYRASLVFDYALPSQGLVIQRAQAAFHNFNTASSVFADMTNADQISGALTVFIFHIRITPCQLSNNVRLCGGARFLCVGAAPPPPPDEPECVGRCAGHRGISSKK